jgi:S1-C subfamily serine protease/Tfp pilus assembly protein PilF
MTRRWWRLLAAGWLLLGVHALAAEPAAPAAPAAPVKADGPSPVVPALDNPAPAAPAAAVPATPLDLPALITRVRPAVVSLVAFDPAKALPGTGTGFLVAPDRIITCRHVFAGCDRVDVRFDDGSSSHVAGLLAENRDWDVALLRVDPPAPAKAVPLKVSADLPVEGETVLIIGGPLGFEWTSTPGIVSAVRALPGLGMVVQHTAPISPGSSGSPVVNRLGDVIGVQQATITSNDNKAVAAGQSLNFAVPGARVVALAPGPLRTLVDCAGEVRAEWRATVTGLLDKCSLRPFSCSDYDSARGYFEAAVAKDPDIADNWFRLGICCERTGDTKGAEDAYRHAVGLDGGLAVALNNLGVICFRQKRTEEAVGFLTRAIERQSNLVIAYSNLADCYNALGRYDDALATCQKGLNFDGRHAGVRYALGVTYLKLGRRELAAEQARVLDGIDKAQADRLRAEIDRGGAEQPAN